MGTKWATRDLAARAAVRSRRAAVRRSAASSPQATTAARLSAERRSLSAQQQTKSDCGGESTAGAPGERSRYRPTPADLRAAVDKTIEDVISDGLRVLFVGINPGLWSGATGHHFARPGNRFWRAIHAAGLTPTLLSPDRQQELLDFGLGITNLVNRTTATAAELTADELRAGARSLVDRIGRHGPRKVAFLGVSTYRVAFGQPKAVVGRQPDRIAGSEVWVLPNPSGLNAHYQLPDLARAYAQLKGDAD
jgi:TDG/mug DNA glycosylase family protein